MEGRRREGGRKGKGKQVIEKVDLEQTCTRGMNQQLSFTVDY